MVNITFIIEINYLFIMLIFLKVYLFQFMSETNIFILAIERDKELNGDKEATDIAGNLLQK